ncbi:MAG TPA: hypothetical protein VE445_03450 [Nitrososphaeraceae archaeon]|nr:hypothetical protein [Nitrososphaeraceae archaeon]
MNKTIHIISLYNTSTSRSNSSREELEEDEEEKYPLVLSLEDNR